MAKSNSAFFPINAEMRNNKIQLTYVHNNEVKFTEITDYKPTLYSESAEETNFKELISGQFLAPVQCSSIREANNLIRSARDNGLPVYGERNFALTFVKENFKDLEKNYSQGKHLIRGFIIDIESPPDVGQSGFPEVATTPFEMNCWCVYDTQTQRYYVWGKHDYRINTYIEILKEHGVKDKQISYHKFEDEKDRLNDFLIWWQRNFPAYVSGWNSSNFDLPYICHRMKKLGIDYNKLSPWGIVNVVEGEFYGKPQYSVRIGGISDLDYLELYKKNRFITRESYKLGVIANIELGTEKVDFSKVASDLRTLHHKDWDLFVTYNIVDVILVQKLDERLGFFAVTFAVAYYAGINYSQVTSPVMTWSAIMYRALIDTGTIMPNRQEHDKASYEGGYVKFPQVGKHRWICSFDLNSLYPHLIMGWNISPETITDYFLPNVNVDMMVEGTPYDTLPYFDQLELDLAVAPSGCTFLKTKFGIAGQKMWELYCERKQIKGEGLKHEQDAIDIKGGHFDIKAMYEKYAQYGIEYNATDHSLILAEAKRQQTIKDGGQMVRKILLNSFYGALANVNFPMFDIRLAESITKSGQLAIRWVGRKTNEYLNAIMHSDNVDYVVYTDTDSIYVNMEAVAMRLSGNGKLFDINSKEQHHIDATVNALDKFCHEHMEAMIERGYEDLKNYTNAYDQKMIMKREVIASSAIFCSKKRYAMAVHNSEGVAFDQPKIKTMGLDVAKSSTPQMVRDAMKKIISTALLGSERNVHEFVAKFYDEFKVADPADIAFPRGVNKLEETYCLSNGKLNPNVTCPINSRAAIVHNQAIAKYGVEVEPILNGDKIKYLFLYLPNKLQSNVIGFQGYLPPELGLHEKIDYETQWFKTFNKPMSALLDLIGWTTEPTMTLNQLFGDPLYKEMDYGTNYTFEEDEDSDLINRVVFQDWAA